VPFFSSDTSEPEKVGVLDIKKISIPRFLYGEIAAGIIVAVFAILYAVRRRYNMISWAEAMNLLLETSKVEHSLLVSNILGEVAKELGENEEEWKLVGLLHDLDYDETKSRRTRHGVVAAKRLAGKMPTRCLHAIRTHDYRSEFKPKTTLATTLIIVDSLVAAIEDAHINRADLSVELLTTKLETVFKEKPWLRTNILNSCEIGLSLNTLLQLSINILNLLILTRE
jgi:hypothetical protein